MNSLMKMTEKKRAASSLSDPAKLEAFSGSPLIDPSEITLIRQIGAGKYGTLYHGKCRGLDVATKIPKKQVLTEEELLSFRKEVEIMSKMFCPNIALFMGASTRPFEKRVESTGESVQGNIMIVSELMKGDLETLMMDKSFHLSLLQRIQMAKDIAQGFASYDETGGVFVIKLCDFGLSQIKPKNENISDPRGKAIGTLLMLPPEVLRGQHFNEKADVYSFALVLWELVSREELFPKLRDGFLGDFIEAICDHHERPPLRTTPDWPLSLRNLLQACWNSDPTQRPAFPEILGQLSEIIVDVTIKDENGNKYWKKHQLTEYSLPYEEFERTFYPFIQYTPTFEQLECFKALVVSRDGKELVTMERFGKLMGWFGPLTCPYKRGGILDKIEKACRGGWFFGEISTQDAVNKLLNSSPGTFIVRFANNPEFESGFCVTKVTRQRKIIHIRVLHEKPEEFSLLDGHSYKSLEDLISDPRLNLLSPYPNPEDAQLHVSNPFGHIFTRKVTAVANAYRDVDEDFAEDLQSLSLALQ